MNGTEDTVPTFLVSHCYDSGLQGSSCLFSLYFSRLKLISCFERRSACSLVPFSDKCLFLAVLCANETLHLIADVIFLNS